MTALLHQLSLFHDENTVGVLNRGKPMGDHQNRLILRQFLEGLLDQRFIFRVSKSGGLIQHDNRRVL